MRISSRRSDSTKPLARNGGAGDRTAPRLLRAAWLAGTTLVVGAAAWAQGGPGGRAGGGADAAMAGVVGRPQVSLLDQIVSTLVFGALGILLLIVGFKIFDLVIRHDIEHEIFENKNMAAAVMTGFVLLGVALIIGATLMAD